MIPFEVSALIIPRWNFMSLKEVRAGGGSSPSTRMFSLFLTALKCSMPLANTRLGGRQLVLMGSMYWIPLANSAADIRAVFSCTSFRSFSSSLNCLSITDSCLEEGFVGRLILPEKYMMITF